MVLLLLRILMWPLMLFVKQIKGIENLPKKQFILAANHASYIDPVLLMLAVMKKTNKKLRFFATNNPRWKYPFWEFWFNYTGAIRINGSLQKGLDALKQGDNLGIFPEGERSASGIVRRTEHKGLGVLALKTRLPVVPAYINTFWWWNRYQSLPSFKRNLKVNIGKPIIFTKKNTAQNAKKAANEVMKEIRKLENA